MAISKSRLDPSIDTNILLRLILRDNERMFEQARARLRSLDCVHVADQAIVEIVFALGAHYKYSRAEICAVIYELMANQHINLNRKLFEAVLPLYEKHPAVSFTDICLAVYAKLNGTTPLLTFDRKLARQIPHVELVTGK